MAKRIKIVHLIHGLTIGGAETLVKDYAMLMDRNKYEIVILCYEHTGSPYEKLLVSSGIKVIFCGDPWEKWKQYGIIGKFIRHYGLYFSIRKHLRREDPDIIHLHLLVSRYVLFSHVKRNTGLIYTVHTEPERLWDKKNIKSRIDFYAARRLVKMYGMRFIALHDEMRKKVDRLFGVNNTVVVNNGIDFEPFQNRISPDEARERLQIPKDRFVVGHVGRFAESKNHRFLIDIFEEVLERNHKAYLLLIGDGEGKTHIQEELEKRGLTGKFQIRSNRTDISDLMSAMDCFVFPSKLEGLGIVVIEAQIAGLPCVVSDRVPQATQISNRIEYHSLGESASQWADAVCRKDKDGDITYYHLEEWDMKNIIGQLEKIYVRQIRE